MEYRVALQTANGPVVTVYRELDEAMALMRSYASEGKAFAFSVERS